MPYLPYGKSGSSGVRKSSIFQIFVEEFPFRQGQIQTLGIIPVLPVPSFTVEEVFFQSSSSKQLPTFGHGLRKGSRFQVFWNFQLRKSTSQDPRDPAVTWYTRFSWRKNFFIFPVQNLSANFGLAIHPNATVKIYCLVKSMAKFSVTRSSVVLISKSKFQNVSSLRSVSSQDPTSKIEAGVLTSQTISTSCSRLPIPVLLPGKCNFSVLSYLI